jgi:hypothetical protein
MMGRLVNDESGMLWNKASVTLLQLLSWHLPEETNKNDENPQSRQPSLSLRFELGVFKIRSESANNSTATLGHKAMGTTIIPNLIVFKNLDTWH